MCRITMVVDQLCSSATERVPYLFSRKCEEKSLIERDGHVRALELPLLYGWAVSPDFP